jgi:hypothetical protein
MRPVFTETVTVLETRQTVTSECHRDRRCVDKLVSAGLSSESRSARRPDPESRTDRGRPMLPVTRKLLAAPRWQDRLGVQVTVTRDESWAALRSYSDGRWDHDSPHIHSF